jgi:hypothetical protein
MACGSGTMAGSVSSTMSVSDSAWFRPSITCAMFAGRWSGSFSSMRMMSATRRAGAGCAGCNSGTGSRSTRSGVTCG